MTSQDFILLSRAIGRCMPCVVAQGVHAAKVVGRSRRKCSTSRVKEQQQRCLVHVFVCWVGLQLMSLLIGVACSSVVKSCITGLDSCWAF